jgi:signal peptide peptidase SppA
MNDFSDALLWYGSESSARQYLEIEARALRDGAGFGSDTPDDRRFGAYSDFVALHGETAVVSVAGSLGYKETDWSRYLGMMTYETLANIMAMLVSDQGVTNAVLDVDSPGGVARGVSLATDAIHAAREAGLQVVAHTTGDMCSAAYWISSAAEQIYASKHADVGSIGVIMVHHEVTKALEQDGVKVTVFRKGDEKALGSPYEPLDDKARASIEERLERTYTGFIDTIAANRGIPSDKVRASIATGKVFSAHEAQSLGLIDGIQTFNHLMNSLVPQGNQTPGAFAMSKTPIFTAEAPAALQATTPESEALADALVAVLAGDPAEPAPEQDPAPEPEPAEAASAAPSAMAGLLGDLNTQLVEAKVALEKATTERDELKAGNAGLRDIVAEYTQTLRIRLGQQAGADLESLPDGSLVATHQAVKAQFVARFKPGAQSSVPKEDPALPRSNAAVTRLDKAVRKATSFGK